MRCCFALGVALALLATSFATALEIEFPAADRASPIQLKATSAAHWQEGAYEVWHLWDGVELAQATSHVRGREVIAWVYRARRPDEPSRVITYFEGEVRVTDSRTSATHQTSGERAQTYFDQTWLGRFETESRLELELPLTDAVATSRPPIYRRAMEARGGPMIDSAVQPAQFVTPLPAGPALPTGPSELNGPPGLVPAPSAPAPIAPNAPVATPDPFAGLTSAGIKRVQIWPRSSVRWQARSEMNPNNPAEQITTITSGVQIVIDSTTEYGTVTVETDRIVIWSPPVNVAGIDGQNPMQTTGAIELYLEGNVVFRQGDRLIYADRMYYNATQEYGVVLAAEMLTPVKEFQGLVRLKADVLQQIDRQRFQAYGAAVTTSRLGVPRYWLQSERVTFEDRAQLAVDPVTGQAPLDPATGEQQLQHEMLATSRNNFLYFGQVPIFYWPSIATDLKKPTFYITGFMMKSDTIFGQQLLVDYDVYQLLGMTRPPTGTNWSLSSDYLSERGYGFGTRFDYNRPTLFGLPGPAYGFIDAWGIQDGGRDVLGADRLSVEPEADFRGRILARHRQDLPRNFQLTGELGLISDRNFLEQYFEREWDQSKDATTGVELKQMLENGTWALSGDVRINDFFAQTEWLPRLDHFVLGQDLAGERLTWFAHSSAGYGHLRPADAPTNPVDAAKFTRLAWETDAEGFRKVSRHELDLPVDVGPVKVVPYVLGELAYWQEDINGDNIGRAYGQTGIRASMPMWRVNPDVRSELLNLNGLAQKIVFEAEAMYADASQNLERFPLYDQLDDDAQEQFRRRFYFNTFNGLPGGFIPLRFDERNYAFRSGMQSWVTAPSAEIVDDLTMVRLGLRSRWQTKRGPAGREHIVDWITFDLDGSLYPNANRDNFGETLGMVNYDFKWHIGDRFSVLSDGYADLFDQGLRQITVGANLARPESGNLYVGARSTEGPISSTVLLSFANYRLSEKWIANAGFTYDLGSTGNIGQSLGVTRVGEAFLVTVGMNYDASRQNLSAFFGIEPRIYPRGRQGIVGGVRVPPPGTFGLE